MGTASQAVVEVKSEVFGSAAAPGSEAMPTVSVDLSELEAALSEQVTVSELIGRVVEEQVRELVARRRSEALETYGEPRGEIRDILDRQYLTAQEIACGATEGTVTMPVEAQAKATETRKDTPQIDVGVETRKARRAFGRGAYYIIVDGRQMEGLDSVVEYTPRTEITFLRAMPLVGG